MADLTASVIERRGADWNVGLEYVITGKPQATVRGTMVDAVDVRQARLPVSLRSLEMPADEALVSKILTSFCLLRQASLDSPYINDIYKIVHHQRGANDQLIIVTEPVQGRYSGLIEDWTSGAKDAPPAMDDAHALHTGLLLVEALSTLEEAGASFADIRPESIGLGSSPPWTFSLPLLVDFHLPGLGSGAQRPPSFVPHWARSQDVTTLGTQDHAKVDLYAVGAMLFQLRTWSLWKGADESKGLTDAALLELNKMRVGNPLKEVFQALLGTEGAEPTLTTLHDARELLKSHFWDSAGLKSGKAIPMSPAAALSPLPSLESSTVGQDSLVILEDRELWARAPEAVQDAVITEVGKGLEPDYKFLRTEVYSCGGQHHRLATFEHIQTGMELNLIPGGLFDRGTSNSQAEADWCEKHSSGITQEWIAQETPVLTVIVPPMLVGRNPVLIPEWEKMTKPKAKDSSDLPITDVSRLDILKTLEKCSGQLRMPSESEWEYACRAGTATRFFWGDSMDNSLCWHSQNSGDKIHGAKEHASAVNAFGLVDMLGNVLEWCEDHYSSHYSPGAKDHHPSLLPDPAADAERVVRGGCAWYTPGFCRAAARAGCRSPIKVARGAPPPPAFPVLGWRAVRSIG